MDWSLLILAAGISQRLGENKISIPIGPAGEWLMEFTIYDALLAGCRNVVLVTRADTEALVQKRLAQLPSTVTCSTVVQSIRTGRSKPCGTAEAVVAAASKVQGPFLVVNGDDYYGRQTLWLLIKWLVENIRPGLGALPVFSLANANIGRRPVWRALCRLDDSCQLVDLKETLVVYEENKYVTLKPQQGEVLPSSTWVSMNSFALPADIIPLLSALMHQFYMNEDPDAELTLAQALMQLISTKQVCLEALPSNNRCIGLTYPEDVLQVRSYFEELIAKGLFPSPLWFRS
ncbi:MAG: NTP transferase domain-containing protein [Chitinophagales bacterium]|nr:NTP transferase domain-containing protein [Chitinophagales bacterium]MDW8427157.1 NTP transferase domain-containing protein [Chitinophagales bacterium]